MIKEIRTSKFTKVVCCYLCLMLVLEMVQPLYLFAATSGPKQPEFMGFTPIATSDMVDLSSGDFNYNIPIMDVGGYPINLAYNSGITMDQEASWVGLGWNLNVGQIDRQVRGLPDDFKGDLMEYEDDLRDNVTVGTNFNVSNAFFGTDFQFNLGIGVQYNNYEGITFTPNYGVSYKISDAVSVGMDFSSTTAEGATVTPSASISTKLRSVGNGALMLNTSFGLPMSSRKGFENISTGMGVRYSEEKTIKKEVKNKETGETEVIDETVRFGAEGGFSGALSFNTTNLYTPTKRVAFENNAKTFNATIGTESNGVEGQVRITGFGYEQKIRPEFKQRSIPAFGYENSHFKGNNDGILDFNRENEHVISKNTTSLPVSNYTYDVYSINGQGVGGMFRPHRSQVSYLYNDKVSDASSSQTFGAELGVAGFLHLGANYNTAPSISNTGLWKHDNNTLNVLSEKHTDANHLLYESAYFKMVGQMDVDRDTQLYDELQRNKAQRLRLDGQAGNVWLSPAYNVKQNPTTTGISYTEAPITQKLKRKKRVLRNQDIQPIKASANDKFVKRNEFAKSHHNAGMKVLQNDGTTYVYGETAYNTKKEEVTFDVSGSTTIDSGQKLVRYSGNPVTPKGSPRSDQFLNKVVTPPYAHTYLLTSVLSVDYEDIDNNGPSDMDLGTYTKFSYVRPVSSYKWRAPYTSQSGNWASFNEGLKSSEKDQRGTYIYGEKELKYLSKIETKTHVAFFDLEERTDSKAAEGEGGGRNDDVGMSRLKSIRLYSKSELTRNPNGEMVDPATTAGTGVTPIKTAFFEYDYSLCKKLPSNINANVVGETEKISGKLTLTKIYFTYRSSKMGAYTPYKFTYSEVNPKYDRQKFDVWGNFKNSTPGGLSHEEFPFATQDYETASSETSAWALKTIQLPSGGIIELETESDDYQFVQDRRAMQMYFVRGVGQDENIPSSFSTSLYHGGGTNHAKYLYVELGNADAVDPIEAESNFKKVYLQDSIGRPVYFRFLLNMTENRSDFVSGYFLINQSKNINVEVQAGKTYAAIPLKSLTRDGGVSGSGNVNPISKAGWHFGRTYLNRLVYSWGNSEMNDDFESVVLDLVSSIASISELFTGPNKRLETAGCARTFNPNKSWIRLGDDDGRKYGGGLRVKKVKLSDKWDLMNQEGGSQLYGESYGQEYSYALSDSTSSGVATFEPNMSPENPFVEPVYGKVGSYEDKIAAPKESNYVEKPFGQGFFPSPKVTYSRVTVSNLNKEGPTESHKLKRHGTGRVVTEFYTSRDFPTIVRYTDIDMKTYNPFRNPLANMLHARSTDHVNASQGYTIETNDMNGRIKQESVFQEGSDVAISWVKYLYNVDERGKLLNEVTTIDGTGAVTKNTIGVDYDVIHDFNENYSNTKLVGGDGNVAIIPAPPPPLFLVIPIVLPRSAYHEARARTAVTTKVVHRTAIQTEKIAFDLGSVVSTKNIAWDAQTGQVLLTETVNEYDDHYFTLNYPAYWVYENMGMSSHNIGMTGHLSYNVGGEYDLVGVGAPNSGNIKDYLKIGDELIVDYGERVWVSEYVGSSPVRVKLMKRNGTNYQLSYPEFKIVRSGNRNLQAATMASVTSMWNPIDTNQDGILNNLDANTFAYSASTPLIESKRVINASAIEYGDKWLSQCENGLPNELGLLNGIGNPVNPFLYNIRGDWRPIISYAYLAGRNNFETQNPRAAGFYKHFSPYYVLSKKDGWVINGQGWTWASAVTMHSPYGPELENKDALDRFSSAQYGYGYTLPVAVSSNSGYKEMGYDGFEDYDSWYTPSLLKPHFGFSQAVLNDKAIITNLVSHSGRNSMMVSPRTAARFTRKIDGCKDSIPPWSERKTVTTKKKSKNSSR